MQYRTDLRSGNKLSVLGFGCMRFPRTVTGQFDYAKTERLLLDALEQGVNYLDTAYLYSGSEELLGRFFAAHDVRGRVFLATKLPHYRCKAYEDFDKIFAEQLERLHTDYIDYYLIHNIAKQSQWDTLVELGIERWIAEKKASGAIRQIGFSFHGPLDDFLAMLDAYEWDFCQIQYNYMNENYQAGRTGLEKAHAMGMPVIIMEPLLGGKLADALPAKAAQLFKQANPELSPAAWALRWIWDQPGPTVVLSGMNSPEQLSENIAAAANAEAGMLGEAEAAVFPPVRKVFEESFKVPCTGCNYCMPCPQNVNIPGCFAAYNMSYAVGFVSGMTQYITSTGSLDASVRSSASSCIKCGVCEKKCPQNIPIINSLRGVCGRFEPFWMKPVLKLVMRFR
jgi:predicted aldo/keto reductase-like oxidoreductase